MLKKPISSLEIWGSIGLLGGGVTTGILIVVLSKLAQGEMPRIPTWMLWVSYGCFALSTVSCIFVENAKVLGWLIFAYFLVLLGPELCIWLVDESWFDRTQTKWLRESGPLVALAIMASVNLYLVTFPPWRSSVKDIQLKDEHLE